MIATRRAQQLSQLKATHFDLLIVGGGIVGAGIARDAMMRGLKVALIEQGDFAGGTSSKTSKLIHGGLRYLEQGQLRLVFESLRERRTLQTLAPGLVHPLSLMLPVYLASRRPAWKINLGLTLYDLLSRGQDTKKHQMLSAKQALEREPNLRVDGLVAAGLYQDCQMDDARLCLANIFQAVRFGAVCGNYLRLVKWLKEAGEVRGALAEDCLTRQTVEIKARCVINATGPWSDKLRRLSNSHTLSRLAPTKGIHLIVPRMAENALFVESQRDSRLFFILPWGDQTLIGTTESKVEGSLDKLCATADEVDHLLAEVSRVLPGSHLTPQDVIATFAGARPLLSFSGVSTQASREHRIEIDSAGLLSVLGGKYTTYRVMAKQAVDAAMHFARLQGEHCLTDQVALMEPVHDVLLDQVPELTRQVDPETLAQLIIRYGSGVISILHALGAEPALADRVCLHHHYLAAEIVYMIQEEMACTVSDIMLRRPHMAWSPCQGVDALPVIEDIFERYGGLTPHQTAGQIEAYRHQLAENLAFRGETVSFKEIAVGKHERSITR